MKNKLIQLALISNTLLLTACSAKKGEGSSFLVGVLLLFSPIIISIIIVLVRYEKERVKRLKPEKQKFDLRRFRTLVSIFVLTIGSYLFVNYVPLNAKKTNREALFRDIHAKNHKSALHFYSLEYLDNPEKTNDFLAFAYDISQIKDLPEWADFAFDLEKLELRNNTEGSNIRIGAIWLMSNNDYYLYQVVRKLPNKGYGVNFLKAKHHVFSKEINLAIDAYHKEIEENGFLYGACSELSQIYFSYDKTTELGELINNPELVNYVPYTIKSVYYFKQGDIYNYTINLFSQLFKNLNIFGFLGGLLILFCWLSFLYFVNPFYKPNVFWSVFTLLFSMIFTLSCLYIYPYINYNIGFTKQDNLFVYSVLVIGLIEESIKVIPFLLVILLSKDTKEPFSYLYYAGISALGFAFTENTLVYLEPNNISIVSARGLITCFSHIFDLTIIAYVLMLNKYRFKLNNVLVFLIGLILALLAHGIYDYILLSKLHPIIFIIFFLLTIQVWATMCNNALNLSKYFDWQKLKDYSNFKFYFSIALVSIVFGEYLLLGFKMGEDVANDSLAGNIFQGLFLVMFLGISLTNFDFFPNYIEKIKIPLDFQSVFFPRIVDTENYIGRRIDISKIKSPRGGVFQNTGEIVSRHIIKNKSNWYLVKLDTPIVSNKNILSDYLLIMINEVSSSIQDFEKIKVNTAFLKMKEVPLEIIIPKTSISYFAPCFIKEG